MFLCLWFWFGVGLVLILYRFCVCLVLVLVLVLFNSFLLLYLEGVWFCFIDSFAGPVRLFGCFPFLVFLFRRGYRRVSRRKREKRGREGGEGGREFGTYRIVEVENNVADDF